MVKIAIDAGHGINTAGKRTPAGEREWTFNNKVVLAIIAELQKYDNVQILRLDDPTGQRDVPLTERTNKANSWGADVVISIHFNASTGRWGNHTGTETYTYNRTKSTNAKSVEIARVVQAAMLKAWGLRDRGLKTANFHMVREPNGPAVLTEGGFMDSNIDIKVMRDDAKLAEGGREIAIALAGYYNLKLKSAGSAPTPTPTPQPTPSPAKTVDQMAREVIAGKHGNGHDARRKSLGITQAQYEQVRVRVNHLASGTTTATPAAPPKKSIDQMAREVIAGNHGQGHDNRRRSLGINQAEYEKVRARVNQLASGSSAAPKGKTIDQMAREVIAGKHGNGHANRQRSLGVNNATYQQVRNRVNQLS